ncbi:unnamed protein product [Orchesella dallaii]|uniref:Uncharacterized protein n=1 Tax=Orchesella dallaii TaxID=48710 RepID=A0ABP1R9I7_9HEXA
MYEKIKVTGGSPHGGTGANCDDQCSFCDRPKGCVRCNSCLKLHRVARVRRVCSKHPKVSFMMDWTKCPECRSDDITEVGLGEVANRPVAQTPPLTPASVQGFSLFSTPPKMAFKNTEPGDMSLPAAKKAFSQTLVPNLENKMDVDEDEIKNVSTLVITRQMEQTSSGVVSRKVDIVPSSSRYATQMPVRTATTTVMNTALVTSPQREFRPRGRSQVKLPLSRFEDEALAAKQQAAQLAKKGKQESPIPPQAPITPDNYRQRQPSQNCNLSSTIPVPLDCPCIPKAGYVLCPDCGYYSGVDRKYFMCSIHAKEGGLKKCPECNARDLDEG